MLKIKILSIGKTKEAWLEMAIAEYTKRLKPIAAFDFIWVKNDEQLLQHAEKEDNLICLDIHGRSFSSAEFSSYLHEKLQQHGSRLTFVIGGDMGLPPTLRQHPDRISLSPLTFTHQLTRLILIEQIYRATEIAKGSHYHK